MGSIDNLSTSSNEHQNSENPLVSIIVITYNSAEYVLETLDSAKAQTYNNIELIISDDCSTDDTVLICKEWIQKNTYRFVRTELVVSVKNTGISANCNRGVNAAHGEWIKLVAGDDALLSNCITDNVSFISNQLDVRILFSGVRIIGSKNLAFDSSSKALNLFSKSAKKQFKQLVVSNKVFTTSSFIRKVVIKELNGFDERIKNMEDYPFWIKATKAGYRLYFMPIDTVQYRVHNESINQSFSVAKLYDEVNKTFYLYQLPNISLTNFLSMWHIYLSLKSIGNHKYKFLKLLSPKWYLLKVLRICADKI